MLDDKERHVYHQEDGHQGRRAYEEVFERVPEREVWILGVELRLLEDGFLKRDGGLRREERDLNLGKGDKSFGGLGKT